MRIGIDGRPLAGNRTGIGRYVFELCRELDRHLPAATFFVYSPSPIELPVVSSRWIARVEPLAAARSLKPVLWLKLRAGALCRQDALDVFWATATLFPILPPSVRKIATVHDLNLKVLPASMPSTHRLAHLLFLKRDLASSDVILTISDGTAARLQRYYGHAAAAVVKPGISAAFGRPEPAEIAATLRACGVAQPYFLSVATWEPRKNLDLLVSAFLSLKAEQRLQDHSLVLVGGAGWKDRRLHSLVERAHVSGVRPLGYVADHLLPGLYAGCQAFVFPSLYEGFGMPVLEARACGARIVTTDTPELREAGGANAVYVAPTFEGIRQGLLTAATETATAPWPELMASWSESARRLASILAERPS